MLSKNSISSKHADCCFLEFVKIRWSAEMRIMRYHERNCARAKFSKEIISRFVTRAVSVDRVSKIFMRHFNINFSISICVGRRSNFTRTPCTDNGTRPSFVTMAKVWPASCRARELSKFIRKP